MISTFWVKTIVGVGLVVLVLFEAGSPQVTKIQLDSAASKAALDSLVDFEKNQNVDVARAIAQAEADKAHAKLEAFSADNRGGVTLTFYRRARSLVLYRWKKTTTYYDVRVEGSSKRTTTP